MQFRTKITPIDKSTYLLEPDMEKSHIWYPHAFQSFDLSEERTWTDTTNDIATMMGRWLSSDQVRFLETENGLQMLLGPEAATHSELPHFLWWIQLHHI